MKGNTNKFMKIHEITPKDYTDLHRLYCQLEDDLNYSPKDGKDESLYVMDEQPYHIQQTNFTSGLCRGRRCFSLG